LWTFRQAGIGYSGLAVVGDRLYTMGAQDGKESLFALDLKAVPGPQSKLWSALVGDLFVNGWGDGPRGTPTVDGDHVYAIGGQGNVVCVTADSGKPVWKKSMQRDLGGQMMSGWGYTESPMVDGELLACTPGGRQGAVAALDKNTGAVRWRSKEFTDPAGYSSLVVSQAGGTRQFVQMTGDSAAGVAAKDGSLLWRFPRRSPTAAIPTPICLENDVYVTSGYGAGCALLRIGGDGAALKAEEVYANKNMTNHHGGVVLVEGHLYGYSDGKGWVCQDARSGEVVWSEKKLGKGSLTCAGGQLYCYTEGDGTVVLVEADPKKWQEKGRFIIPEKTKQPRKGGHIWTHPVVANGRLYLRDQDLIFCYDVSGRQ
jgi:outer membrane protein assembly factor BamB